MARAELKPNAVQFKKLSGEIAKLEGNLAKKKGDRRNIEESIVLTLSEDEANLLYKFIGEHNIDDVIKHGFKKEDDIKLYEIYEILEDLFLERRK